MRLRKARPLSRAFFFLHAADAATFFPLMILPTIRNWRYTYRSCGKQMNPS